MPDLSEQTVDATDDETLTQPKSLDDDEDLQKVLISLAKKVMDRQLNERRAEVQRARDQRLYYRGDQNLAWDDDANTVRTADELEGESNRRVFNIYQGYAKSFIAVFCQARPKVRAEATDPLNPQQNSGAAAGEKYRRVYEKWNNLQSQSMEAARLMWTDGRILTRTTSDGKKETTELFGVLEHRLLITADCFADCPLVEIERERTKTSMYAKYGDDADKRKALSTSAGDAYERNARLAVRRQKGSENALGVSSASGDGLVTITDTYLRPEVFEEIEDEVQRKDLAAMFPNGALIVRCGTTYLESRAVGMDDELDVLLAMPGDGMSRVSVGSAMMTLQDSYNEFRNLAEETLERGIPMMFIDQKAISPEAMEQNKSMPGDMKVFQRKQGDAAAAHFFETTPLNPSAQLTMYMENLAGPDSQFATGQQPALFGQSMQDQKTASGYAQARSQALGMMVLVWKPYVSVHARTLTKAAALGSGRDGDIGATVAPTRPGARPETLSINAKELVGVVFSEDGDENFPESWTERSNKYMQVLQMAGNNPAFAAIVGHPDNVAYGKLMLGLEDLVDPIGDARDKQLNEIQELVNASPVPNPAAPPDPAAAGPGAPPTLEAQNGQMLQLPPPPPPEVPSVPIDPDFDDHATEYAECVRWINSPEGQQAKIALPDGFQECPDARTGAQGSDAGRRAAAAQRG